MVNIEGSTIRGHTPFVLYVNIATCTGLIGLFYTLRHRRRPLNYEEDQLLHEFPAVRSLSDFTPLDPYVPSPAPCRWSGLLNFMRSNYSSLSRDARVYLLFQRLCISLLGYLGFCCYFLFLPSYFILSKTDSAVTGFSQVALCDDSLFLFILLFIVFTTSCYVSYIYVCISVAGRLIDYKMQQASSWVDTPRAESFMRQCISEEEEALMFSPRKRSPETCPRMLLISNINKSVVDRAEMFELLDTLYPFEIAHVEILYHRRACRSKLIRMLHRAQQREGFYIQLLNQRSITSDHRNCRETTWVQYILVHKRNLQRWVENKTLQRYLTKSRMEVLEIEKQLEKAAFLCLQDFPSSASKARKAPIQSFAKRPQSSAEALRVSSAIWRLGEHMEADIAPNPRDIIWNNIGIPSKERFWRKLVLNTITFFLLFLFTSPVTILSTLSVLLFYAAQRTPLLGSRVSYLGLPESITDIIAAFSKSSFIGPLVVDYTPVLLLSSINALMPSLFRKETAWEGYLTRSEEEQSIFRKVFLYYLFNTVLLPLLALNTAAEFLEQFFTKSEALWYPKDILSSISERVFSGDNSYFYVNFIIQLTFTSNTLSFSRLFPTLFSTIRGWLSFSPLEQIELRCNELFDFPLHYATTLKILAIYLCLGLVVPILWPISFLFFLVKHLVDSYNLHFVHPRSTIDGRLPRSVIHRLLMCTILSNVLLSGRLLLSGSMAAAVFVGCISILCLIFCLKFAPVLGPYLLRRIFSLYSPARDPDTGTLKTVLFNWLHPLKVVALVLQESSDDVSSSQGNCTESTENTKVGSLDKEDRCYDTFTQ